LRSEERRRFEEWQRLDEDRRREALQNSERFARERALQEKKRREDEEMMRNRDCWAHRLEMQTSSRVQFNRSPDVSPQANLAPSSSNMVISANPMIPVPPPQGLEVNLHVITPTLGQTGSFAPLAVSATAGLACNSLRAHDDLHDIAGCIRCGGNHREEVCQEKDLEYIAPYYGSVDFGQGFFSIPVMDSDSQPIEQLNYAHITVETGEVTCRDIEHEFNVWDDSMNINCCFLPNLSLTLNFVPDFLMLNQLMN
jgi:hypothetical protein